MGSWDLVSGRSAGAGQSGFGMLSSCCGQAGLPDPSEVEHGWWSLKPPPIFCWASWCTHVFLCLHTCGMATLKVMPGIAAVLLKSLPSPLIPPGLHPPPGVHCHSGASQENTGGLLAAGVGAAGAHHCHADRGHGERQGEPHAVFVMTARWRCAHAGRAPLASSIGVSVGRQVWRQGGEALGSPRMREAGEGTG